MSDENENEGGAGLSTVRHTDAIVLSAAITVQCLGCGTTLILECYNAALADLPGQPTAEQMAEAADVICEGAQGCPTCSEKAGEPVIIETAVLAGSQLECLPDPDEEGELEEGEDGDDGADGGP